MNTRRPEAPKPHAITDLPSPGVDVLHGLDKAHEQGFRRFLRDIGHNKRNPAHRCRASDALATLIKGVSGKGPSPNYYDLYVAAAYLVGYHLRHCMMAYWSFRLLFDRVGVPNSLYVCDIGAGTGAARVGLALALSRRKKTSPTIYFSAVEPSAVMSRAGNAFWKAVPPEISAPVAPPGCDYRLYLAAPKLLPAMATHDDVLRVVTAFHLSLPYGDPCGNVGDAKSSIQSALRLVADHPYVGLFTANSKKVGSLKQVVGDYDCKFPIPRRLAGESGASLFYNVCARDAGFNVPKGHWLHSWLINNWSNFRFSLPKDSILLLRDKRAERQTAVRAEEKRRCREPWPDDDEDAWWNAVLSGPEPWTGA